MTPPISILIATYNRARFLPSAIESVLSQTRPDFELLIWDDGSTDHSLDIAQSYAHQDPRVRVVAAAHRGVAAARQAAVAQLSGAYLGWVDSDDLLAPTALEETAAILETHPEIGMVYTDYLVMDAAGHVQGRGQRCQLPYSKDLLLLCFMTFHFRLLRHTVFRQVGGINLALPYGYDYDLCLRLSEVTTIQRLQKPLYAYRSHPDSFCSQQEQDQIRESYLAIAAALERRGLTDRYAVVLDHGHYRLQRQHTAAFQGCHTAVSVAPGATTPA
jgi:glycosyltransferase involved in cell wall biosynthesis